MDERPAVRRAQRDHRSIVTDGQAGDELVGEGLIGLRHHHPLLAVNPTGVEHPHRPDPLRRPVTGLMSSKEPIGDHSGQVDPSSRRAIDRGRRCLRREFVLDHLQSPSGTSSLCTVTCLTASDCTIWYMSEKSGRDLLLDQVVDHFVTDGLGDLSLRKIAAAIGTSHRMLLYHFGSKNGLLLEVVRAVEARTREPARGARAVRGDPEGSDLGTDQVIRAMWQFVADPAQGDFERLFFALYGRALQGDEQVRPLLGESIESWLEANDALAAAQGIPLDQARVHARLGLAVVRGLLLDLLATGDRAGVDASLEVFARRYAGSWWEAEPSPDGPDPDLTSQTAPSAPAPRSGPGGRARRRRPPSVPGSIRRDPSAMAVA